MSLRLRTSGGELVVRGRTAEGAYEERLAVAPMAPGEGSAAVGALYARELVDAADQLTRPRGRHGAGVVPRPPR